MAELCVIVQAKKYFNMKNLKFLALIGAIMLLSASAIDNSISWQIADGYSIQFAGTDAEGIFRDLEGDIQFDPENPENSTFAFTVAVNSINTGKGMKNKHAVSSKWFDAENSSQTSPFCQNL